MIAAAAAKAKDRSRWFKAALPSIDGGRLGARRAINGLTKKREKSPESTANGSIAARLPTGRRAHEHLAKTLMTVRSVILMSVFRRSTAQRRGLSERLGFAEFRLDSFRNGSHFHRNKKDFQIFSCALDCAILTSKRSTRRSRSTSLISIHQHLSCTRLAYKL